MEIAGAGDMDGSRRGTSESIVGGDNIRIGKVGAVFEALSYKSVKICWTDPQSIPRSACPPWWAKAFRSSFNEGG